MAAKKRTYQKSDKRLRKSFILPIRTFILLVITALTALVVNAATNFDNGSGILMMPGIPSATAQQSDPGENNIIDLKVGKQNGNFVWESSDNQINPQIDMKANTKYTLQLESMNDDIVHEFVIQTSSGEKIVKSSEISNGETDDFNFQPKVTGTYEYHCEYHPETMKGTIVVS